MPKFRQKIEIHLTNTQHANCTPLPVFTAVSGLVICPLTAGSRKEIKPLLTVEI